MMGIKVDSQHVKVMGLLNQAAIELQVTYVLSTNKHEFYMILDKSPTKESLLQLANNLRVRLLKETDAMFSIGISRMREKASELYICIKEAKRAYDSEYLFGYNSVIHIDYSGSNDIEFVDAFTDVARDALFYRLDEVKNANRPVSLSALTQSLDTTAGYIDEAVRRNDGGNIFSYLEFKV